MSQPTQWLHIGINLDTFACFLCPSHTDLLPTRYINPFEGATGGNTVTQFGTCVLPKALLPQWQAFIRFIPFFQRRMDILREEARMVGARLPITGLAFWNSENPAAPMSPSRRGTILPTFIRYLPN